METEFFQVPRTVPEFRFVTFHLENVGIDWDKVIYHLTSN